MPFRSREELPGPNTTRIISTSSLCVISVQQGVASRPVTQRLLARRARRLCRHGGQTLGRCRAAAQWSGMLPCASCTVPTSTRSRSCRCGRGFRAQKAASWRSSQASSARLFRRSAALSAHVTLSFNNHSIHPGHCRFTAACPLCEDTCMHGQLH